MINRFAPFVINGIARKQLLHIETTLSDIRQGLFLSEYPKGPAVCGPFGEKGVLIWMSLDYIKIRKKEETTILTCHFFFENKHDLFFSSRDLYLGHPQNICGLLLGLIHIVA